ncbi:MAG: recombinase family protein [Candidatus Obscuribacterales bacterium]|nr:recombinase family protein [Candidatus Obscuribacterales bacterium]
MASVAVYARTSTQMQTNGLQSQLLALKAYCESKGIPEPRVYTDAAVSGAKSSRPGLDQLLIDAKAGNISQVITYSLSRLSRSTSHLLQTLELFRSLNIGFISLSENIDMSTPTGLMIVTVLGAVAQLEREITVERVRCGLQNAKAKGKRLGAPPRHQDKHALIHHLASQNLPHREIARLSGVSQSTVSRTLRMSDSKLVAS